MERVQVTILNPEAKALLQNLEKLGAISIGGKEGSISPERPQRSDALKRFIGSLSSEEAEKIRKEINRSRDEDWED